MMHRRMLVVLFFTGIFAQNDSQRELEAGNSLLVKAKFADALSHFHKAIELDPSNYQAIYRRATTYLATGRPRPALVDLDTVLEQKPDFGGARLQRANVFIKMGQLQRAAEDLQFLISVSSTPELTSRLEVVELNQRHLAHLKHTSDCEHVEEMVAHLLEEQLWDASLYRQRAKCYERTDKLKLAIHDMKHASKLSSDDVELLFELSELQYKVADVRGSLASIRECLKIDPDHKKCYKSYKVLRKTVRSLDSMIASLEEKEYSKCLKTAEKLLDGCDESVKLNVFRVTCQCNREEGNLGTAITECSWVLDRDESDVEMLIQRAETYMADEEYDMAIADYSKAAELDSQNEAAKSGIEQAKRAKELVGKRDYYKILGVKRSATKREITKAYRKMAQKWHPDNYQDEKEKKRAEKKFIDIAAAKEVLGDEEKRRQFDSGVDPLDPEEAQRGGGGGFHGGFPKGFNPFGGGRGDFFFHF